MSAKSNQIELPFDQSRQPSVRPAPKRETPRRRTIPQPTSSMDQLLSTHDVERITNRHRCTIYRWILAGTFPAKRAGGGHGWLRSDVERWLQGTAPPT